MSAFSVLPLESCGCTRASRLIPHRTSLWKPCGRGWSPYEGNTAQGDFIRGWLTWNPCPLLRGRSRASSVPIARCLSVRVRKAPSLKAKLENSARSRWQLRENHSQRWDVKERHWKSRDSERAAKFSSLLLPPATNLHERWSRGMLSPGPTAFGPGALCDPPQVLFHLGTLRTSQGQALNLGLSKALPHGSK